MTEPQLTLGLGPLADVRVTPTAPAPTAPARRMGPELAPTKWRIWEFGYSPQALADLARERSERDGCSLCGGPCGFGSLTAVVSMRHHGPPTFGYVYCIACRQNDERVPAGARIGKGEP